jgi:CO/xanthine dehydrogenase FAD-binding subunit
MVRDAVAAALDGIEPMEDPYASAAYRRRAAVSLAVRAVIEANASAQTRGVHAG